MARGRLTDASIARVRESARIDQVIGDYVALKRAGAGTLKGLCPFHDEKSPSFHVTPDRGFFKCFGCDEGGDVIAFLQKVESLDFIEAIENLADRFALDLDFQEATGRPDGPDHRASRATRTRLVEANQAAAEYYAAQLLTPDGEIARRYLTDRTFTRQDALRYGCGYAPNRWDALLRHLSGQGFTVEELDTAGLISTTGPGRHIDRFRGRLIFPIRDQSANIIGFGARKLLSDDEDKGPKYLNTPETPLYKKSRVLFGLDTARKHIAKQRRVVVVEGYTDVMACHLSGEETAVATCGTAFGEDHIRIIRRLLGDDGTGGEVIYTFDGDSAGQKAALRAFTMDDHFQTRTSVAVAEDGMDPCELRIAHGPEGVRHMLDARTPLFEFAIKSTLSQFNLATPEGRANAVAAVTPILSGIRHPEMRDTYVRQVARWTGADHHSLRAATNTPGTRPAAPQPPAPGVTAGQPVTPTEGTEDPYERPDPNFSPNSRDALTVLVQDQHGARLATADLRRHDFIHPAHRAIWDAVMAALDTHSEGAATWTHAILAQVTSPTLVALITELSVIPFRTRTGITRETATKTFLQLVTESCQRRTDWIEHRLADPDLPEADVTALLADLPKIRHREIQARDRLAQIDATRDF